MTYYFGMGNGGVSNIMKIYYSNKTNKKDQSLQFKPDYKVLYRFRQAFDQNIKTKKTHLHIASRINWNLFNKYLDWLKNNDFIKSQTQKEKEFYVLTDTGREMFAKLENFLVCIKI